MAAGRTHGDRARQVQLIEIRMVDEFSDLRGSFVSARPDFTHKHLGHTPCCFIGVVVVRSVDYQHVEQVLDGRFNFRFQQLLLLLVLAPLTVFVLDPYTHIHN